MACGQRGWKWQPDGGRSGLGTSPVRTISSRRSSGWLGSAAENSACGVGMLRRAGERLRLAALDDLAQVHDHDRVAHVRDGGEVVGDEQVGQTQLGLQIAQQVQDLGADRHVERGDGLVEHDQLGRQRQRPRDGDALALAARELVREEVGRAVRQPDEIEQVAGRAGAPRPP